MNPYDYAMQLEKEGQELYLDFAQKAPEKGMAAIFRELAGREQKHYETFQAMKENQSVDMPEADFMQQVKDIFAGWRNLKDQEPYDQSQADLYKKALEVEKRSIDFYAQEEKKINDQKQKKIFLQITEEERKHYEIIENVIEFMLKPHRWVEHPMFSKVGEEY